MSSIHTSSGLKLNFSAEEDDRLIEEVGKHPALYDLKNKSYKDQRMRDNIWTSIADAVGRSVTECKKRWKNIKDCNDRRLRETNRTGSEAPPSKKNKKGYVLQEKLSFLYYTDSKRRSFFNRTQEGEAESDCDNVHPLDYATIQLEDTDNTPCSRTQPSSDSTVLFEEVNLPANNIKQSQLTQSIRKKKRSKERGAMIKDLLTKDEESDDLTLFFKSICETVRKFPPALQQRAKLQTLTLVSNLELEMWSGKIHPTDNVHIVLPSPTSSTITTNSSGYTQSNRASTSLRHQFPEELFCAVTASDQNQQL